MRAINQVMEGYDARRLATISVHGTATMYNDQMESKAIERAGLSATPLSALKGYYGHTLGAAGLLETILTARALDDGIILPVNNYLRAIPYKGGKLCVVCYHSSAGDLLDLVNIGLDVALLATGHTTWGSIFLATDLLLTNNDLMEKHVLYLLDKGPNEKGKIIMTRLNDKFMEQLLRDDPVTFEQYYGRGKKSARQSASNILPILVKKGLIEDYHHKQ